MEAAIVLIIVVMIIIAIPVSMSMSRETNRAWTEAARQLGLRFRPPSFLGKRQMSGAIQGFRVRIDTYSQSHGKSSTTYTRFDVSFPASLGLGLKLTAEGFFSGIAKRLGSQDIEVGDAAFDPGVLVKGHNEAGVIRFLTPARRHRIQRFLTSHRGAVVHDRGLEWRTARLLRDTPTLTATARSMASLAWFLTGDRSPDERLERALEARSAGRPDEALAALEERTGRKTGMRTRPADSRPVDPPDETAEEIAVEDLIAVEGPEGVPDEEVTAEDLIPVKGPEARPEEPADPADPEASPLPAEHVPVEERVLEAELLELAGREEEARARYKEALAEAPEDPELLEWVSEAVETGDAGAPGEASETATPVAAPDPASAALDVASVCQALFVDHTTSYRTNQLFTERYQDRTVRWPGMLRRVERYSFDMVFGHKGGTRAIVEVHQIKTGVFGDRQVNAVVQLPPEAREALRNVEGHPVIVEGRLVKVDSLMRNLYVADGQVGPDGG
jgi:hypothetical protein